MTWRKTNPTDQQFKQILNNQQNILTQLTALNRKVQIMTDDQSHPDEEVAQIVSQNERIANAVDALKSQPGAAALNFAGLDAAVAGEATETAAVEGLETPPTA